MIKLLPVYRKFRVKATISKKIMKFFQKIAVFEFICYNNMKTTDDF